MTSSAPSTRCATALVSTLFFVLNNHDDAMDAAQDAFLKCWRNRAGLGQVQNLRAGFSVSG